MTPQEFLRWRAFDRLQPIGQWRADLRAARICAAILNSRGVRAKTSDFMPDFDPAPPKKMTVDEMKAIFRG